MKNLKILVAAGLLLGLNTINAHAELWSPFTVVEVTTDAVLARVGNNDVVVQPFERSVDSQFAQVGSSPSLFAKGRAGFGETGSFAVASGQPSNYGAYAETGWSDAFTIFGGTGAGTLSVSVLVEGGLSGAGANATYALFASDSPITQGQEGGAGLLGFSNDGTSSGPDGSSKVINAYGLTSGTHVYSADIPFTYGTTFYIASYLSVEALGDGTADFFGSSHFAATAPGGLAVTGASGVTYAQAAVVPVPSAAWLFGSGFLGLLSRKRSSTISL